LVSVNETGCQFKRFAGFKELSVKSLKQGTGTPNFAKTGDETRNKARNVNKASQQQGIKLVFEPKLGVK
jgi:hypothetical protein